MKNSYPGISVFLRTSVSVFIGVLLILLLSFRAESTNYYWVNGTGNWSQGAHWSTTSGGSGGTVVPGLGDNVYFDGLSGFTGSSRTVTIDVLNASCNDMDWTGALNTPIFSMISANSLNIYGSLKLVSPMTLNLSGAINFLATTTGKTITTAGNTFTGSGLNFNGNGGGWTLQDNLTVTGTYPPNGINLNYGTFNTNNFNISTPNFYSNTSNTRSLSLGSSTITITSGVYDSWKINATNLTFSAGSSLIKFTFTTNTNSFNGGTGLVYNDIQVNGGNYGFTLNASACTFHDVTLTSVVGIIAGANTYNSLTLNYTASITASNTIKDLNLSAGKTYTLTSGTTQTITGNLTANGTCGNEISILASVNNSQANISKSSGTVNVDYVIFKDNKALGGAVFNATNSTILSNTTGWTVTPPSSTGAAFYWINGSGNWSDPAHWSFSSGGPANSSVCIPGSTNNVYFDALSGFTSSSRTVTIDVLTASCNDMDWSGAPNTPTFTMVSSNSLNVYGSLKLITPMTLSLSGALNFNATSTGKTITTAGNSFSGTGMYFLGSGGGWTLQDNLTVTGGLPPNGINLNYGSLNTNNFNITTPNFYSNTSTIRSLNLGSSIITITSGSSDSWKINSSNLTFNAGTSLIRFTYTAQVIGFTGGTGLVYNDITVNGGLYNFTLNATNCTFHDVTVTNATGVINGANTYNDLTLNYSSSITASNTIQNLILAAGKTYTLTSATTQTINGGITANGVCGNEVTIQASTGGSQANISKSSGTITVDYVLLKDNNATGGAVFNASNSSILSNTTGWNVTPPASTGAAFYWINGAGNWSDASHWSLSSGGPANSAGCIPGSTNNVFFDAASGFTSSSKTVTVDVLSASCNDMDWTGALNTPTFSMASANALNIYGSLKLISPMTLSLSGAVYFNATSTGKTITSAGNSFASTGIYFNGVGGGWSLQDNFTATGSFPPNGINLNYGTFNTNNYNISVPNFYSNTSNIRSLNLGSSTITITSGISDSWKINASNLTFNAGTSLIRFTYLSQAISFSGGSNLTYNDIQVSGGAYNFTLNASNCIFHDVTINNNSGVINGANTYNSLALNYSSSITGSNTIKDLAFSAGKTYTITASTTQTLTGNFTAVGSSGQLIVMLSSSAGTQCTISKGSGCVLCDYLQVKDSRATGGASFYAGANSINVSNNTGWNFSTPSPLPGGATITGADTVCSGTGGIVYSVSPISGATSYVWTVPAGATITSGQGTTSITVTFGTSSGSVTVYGIDGSCAASPTVTHPVLNLGNVPVSVSITATPSGAICQGATITFNAAAVNGGTSPTYQWKLNGSNTGSNSSTYISSSLQNNDIISCQLVSNLACISPVTATSNALTMTVNPVVTPAVSISVSPSGTICAGTNVTFTAVPVNGGTPIYQWKKNGLNVGNFSVTYVSNSLANNDIITCVMTSNASCATQATATSNAITMIVDPVLTPSVNISASPSTAICTGTPVTFTASPVNGGTPVYQWLLNGSNTGSNSYTYFNDNLSNNDQVSCMMTSNASCATPVTVTSNIITMAVSTVLTPSVSIAMSPSGTICAGTAVTFTATPVNGGTPIYQWLLNGANAGNNSNTFVSSSLANNDIVSCVMTSNDACANPATATSNALTMSVNPVVVPAVSIAASPAGAICAGTSVTFTATPVNGGTPVYQWLLNGSTVGSNSSTYINASFANSDQVRCLMVTNTSCASPVTATSNTISMTVNPVLTPGISIAASPAGAICAGTSVTFTASPVNGGTPVYQWKLNGNDVGNNSVTYVNSSLANNDIVTCVMVSNASCANPVTATSNAITMTVNPALTPTVSISASPAGAICDGTYVTFTASATNGGTPVYQWKRNGSNVGINNSTYGNGVLANNDLITCVMTSNLACTSPVTATSNTITMTVNPVLPPVVTIAASPSGAICAGTTVTFTATPVNGGTPSYQWKRNGTNTGNNTTTYVNSALVSGDIITCVMTANGSCASPTTATSNAITMTVNPVLSAAVSIAAVPAGAICAGTSVTFTATPTNGGTPVYQWKLNGSNVGNNTTTFVSTTLANNDQISCIMTSSATCANPVTSTSNTVTMSVNPVLIPAVTIAASPSTSVCSGTTVTFTATPVNGGTPVYQWKLNGANVGTNSVTYVNAALTNGNTVYCVMTSNATCAKPVTATSNTLTMTVGTVLTPSVTIAASPSGAVCAGTSVTFTATPVNGGTPTYQWQVNGSNAGSNQATYVDAGLVSGNTVRCIMTSNISCASVATATSNTITMTVNPLLTPAVSIAASPSGNICAGTNVIFTATPTNGGTPVYQWKRNGTNVGTSTVTYSNNALADNDIITCVMTSSATCASPATATSNAITMSVTPTVTPAVTITAVPSGAICAGTSVTFTAAPVNGGTPVYQWQLNGVSTGNNQATFVSNSLANGNIVRCIMTSNATCPSPVTATSNAITMTVNPILTPAVSITANPSGAICPGTSVTFTAAPVNGGTPVYQWILNGSNAGNNTSTYVNAGLANSDVISCIMTSNATCAITATATSNSITMTVNPALTPAISIAASPSGNICAGTNVIFTATPTNGGTPVYQWKRNGTNVGTSTVTYSNNALANNDIITCVMTSSATCASPATATSNAITMSVTPTVTPAVTITATPSGAICAGTSVTFTATPVNGGTPVYQWQLNGVNTGSNQVTFVSSSLANGNIVRCIMTSNATCPSPVTATSNAITMTVNPILTPAVSITANPSGAICPGTSVTFTAAPVNGGTPVYQWILNGSNAGNNTSTYVNAGLANNDVVSCIMTSNATCTNTATATSNIITMSVNPLLIPAVSISASPSNSICAGTAVTFTASPTNGGTPVYQWKRNGANVGTNSVTYSNAALANNDIITCVMTSNITCASPITATSNAITMTVTPTVTPTVTIAAVPSGAICAGTSVTFTATPVNGGTPVYQWQLNGVNTGNNQATFVSNSLANGNIVRCVMTSNATCPSPATATSNAITMTVNPILTPSVSITANPAGAICPGTSVRFTAVPVNGGTPAYQWKLNGVNVGNNTTTYVNAGLANNDSIICIMTSNATCAGTATATSNMIIMSVNPVITPAVSISASPSNSICAGTAVTFTASPTNGGTPVYQWKLNGANVGTNSITYVNSTLANNSIITCVMTSNITCASPITATSNAITMTVTPTVTPTVTIAAVPSGAICAGTSVTFTATPVNGGTPVYQWQLNGVNTGSNQATFVSNSLANGNIVRCIMTSNATCPSPVTATSNAITMTVNPIVTPSVSITANPAGAICAGTSVTFTAIPANGGTPVYQWKLNGSNVGNNTPTYVNAGLANNDSVSCVMISNTACATTATATSNTITMTVNTSITPSVTITASPPGPICYGTYVTFTATAVNGGTPVYQWKRNGANVGTNSTTYGSNTFMNNTTVACVITSNSTCASPATATSNIIVMSVNFALTASVSITASPSGAICAGTPVTFTATPVNGGIPTYQWKLNGGNVGTNSITYVSSSLANSNVISCVMTSNLSCANPATVTSNAITMTVNPVLTPAVSIAASPSGAICSGTNVVFTASPTNGGTPVYQWQLNGVPTGNNSSTYSSNVLADNDAVGCLMTSNATCVTPATASSNIIVMSVNPVLTPAVTIAASPSGAICNGTSVTFTATATNGGTPVYQWKRNGNNVGSNSSTYINGALANNDIISCVITSNAVCANPVTATSNALVMSVNSVLTPAVSIIASPPGALCAGDPVTFTAMPVNGGTPSYQWIQNGSLAGTNASTYMISNPANNDNVYCIMTSNVSCANPVTATSNTLTIVVNPIITPSVSISASPAGAICAGTNVMFTAVPVNGGTPVYQWKLNGSNTGSNSMTFASAGLANGDLVTCEMVSNAGCANPLTATSNVITMAVNPILVPSVTISAAPSGAICAGTAVTFTATPANGGTPVYLWKLNGSIVGNNSATYVNGNLTTNDIVICIMISNATCANPVTATSNIITMSVNPAITPAVSIAASPSGAICTGTTVTFTATPTNGGTPVYQWKLNGTNVGSNSITYINSSLLNSDVISCEMISNAGCANPLTATSNAIILSVNSTLTPAVSITASPSGSICGNTSVAFTASPVNGGTPAYQWKLNGISVGNNSITFVRSGLADNDIISCIMTSNISCASPATATSNLITMDVLPDLIPVITISASLSDTICPGASTSYSATITNGGTTPVYQWYINSNPVGGNSSTYAYATPANGDIIRCSLTSSYQCPSQNPVTSANHTIVYKPLPVATILNAGPISICQGASTLLNAGPGAGYTYQWQLNGNDISGAQSQNYSATLAGDYTVIATDNCASDTSGTVTINYLAGTSTPASPSGLLTVCFGTTETYTTVSPNGLGYIWTITPAAAGSITGNGTSADVTWSGTYTGTATVNVAAWGSCDTSGIASTTVTVSGGPSGPAPITGPAVVCANSISVYSTSAPGATAYIWDINPPTAGTLTNSGDSLTVTWNNQYLGSATISVYASNACDETSSVSMPVSVDSAIAPLIFNGGPGAVCQGTYSSMYTASCSNALGFYWTVTPAAAGTISGSGDTAIIYWDGGFTGNALISVAAFTTCDTGVPSVILVGVMPSPGIPAITVNGNIFTSSIATTYQWFYNGSAIPGSTQRSDTAVLTGDYFVVVQNTYGCPDTSAIVHWDTLTGIQQRDPVLSLSVYPNPFADAFYIDYELIKDSEVQIGIYDGMGRLIAELPVTGTSLTGLHRIRISGDEYGLADGLYMIRIVVDGRAELKQLVRIR